MPVIVKLAFPFGKWNKLLGETTATQMKWYLLTLFKQMHSSAVGCVTFIDSTGISLLIPGCQYDSAILGGQLRELLPQLERHLQACLADDPKLASEIRSTHDGVEILNDHGSWIQVRELISTDVYAGVAKVERPRLQKGKSYSNLTPVQRIRFIQTVKSFVHKAEIVTRARAEKMQEDSVSSGGDHVGDRMDDRSPISALRLGRGYFPEGYIPTRTDLLQALYSIYERYIRNGEHTLVPSERHFDKKATSNQGLLAIYNLASAVTSMQRGDAEAWTAGQLFHGLVSDLESLREARYSGEEYTRLAHLDSEALSRFLDGSIRLLGTHPGKAKHLYEFIQLSGEQRVSHRAGRYAGRQGALTRIQEAVQSLDQLARKKKWGRTEILRYKTLLSRIANYVSLIHTMVSKDLSDALMDSRFPNKYKYHALAHVVAKRFKGRDFHQIVFDYDNLSSFMKNPANLVDPESRFDMSKFNLEAIIFETAMEMGLIPENDLVYASPGGDEMVICIPTTRKDGSSINANEFIDEMRAKLSLKVGDIQSPGTHKIWVEQDDLTTTQERWPLYAKEETSIEGVPVTRSYAVDLRDQERLDAYLADGTTGVDGTIRAFSIIHGMGGGGVLVDHMPMTQFATATPETNTVGISATFDTLFPKQDDESMHDFERRMNQVTEEALGILDTVKILYGKNRTWNLRGDLERRLLEHRCAPIGLHHRGHQSWTELAAAFLERRFTRNRWDLLLVGQLMARTQQPPSPRDLEQLLGRHDADMLLAAFQRFAGNTPTLISISET